MFDWDRMKIAMKKAVGVFTPEPKPKRCPACNSTNVYLRKDGTMRCRKCKHDTKTGAKQDDGLRESSINNTESTRNA